MRNGKKWEVKGKHLTFSFFSYIFSRMKHNLQRQKEMKRTEKIMNFKKHTSNNVIFCHGKMFCIIYSTEKENIHIKFSFLVLLFI